MRASVQRIRSAMGRRIRTMTRSIPSRNMIGTIYQTPLGIFSISSSDIALANVLRRNRPWAVDEVQWILGVAKDHARVLVVGAHVGTLAIPIAQHVDHVEAVEANPDTFRFLAANTALNQVENIRLRSFAAGETDGEIEFILSRENSGGAKRKPIVADPMYTRDRPALAKVPMRRLDDAIDGSFNIIVMDIEGSEVFALRGMHRLLADADHLFIEFLPHHLRNVANVTSDALADLVLPHLPRLAVGSSDFIGEGARAELRRMFLADEAHDLIRFSKTR